MTFQKRIKQHLESYKNKHFPDHTHGTWRNKAYKHILPNNDEDRYLNILPEYREQIKRYLSAENISLHYAFHHLNSSQAMCLNFFYPLYQNKSLEFLTTRILNVSEEINYDTVSFEKKGEERGFGTRPTYFDFYFETKSKKKFYFEIKYSENGFGQGKVNNERYTNFYAKHLNQILKQGTFNEQIFYKNYQIFRNLIHINQSSYVVFVYPKKNRGVMRGLDKGKEFLNLEYHEHLVEITWEELYTAAKKSLNSKKILTQVADFKDKYMV